MVVHRVRVIGRAKVYSHVTVCMWLEVGLDSALFLLDCSGDTFGHHLQDVLLLGGKL